MVAINRWLIVPVILLMVLSPGCSTGRYRGLQRRTIVETNLVHRDSTFLQNLFQISRNTAIDIEHTVFDTCHLVSAVPLVRSVTRIAVREQEEKEVESSAVAGSTSNVCSFGSDVLQEKQEINISSGKWIAGGVLALFILFILIQYRQNVNRYRHKK